MNFSSMTDSELIRFATQKPRKPAKKKAKSKKSKSFTDKVTGEKRVILQGKDYTGLRWQKYQAVGGKCERCGRSATFEDSHLHHRNGRGGGKRQDTLEATVWLCKWCHWDEHNPKVVPSKRDFVSGDKGIA